MTRLDGWRLALVVVGLVVLADQVTKALIVANRMLGQSESVFIGIDLNYVRNSGVAFGALAGGGALVWVLTTVAVVGLVGYFAVHSDRPWLWLPVGAIAGGALGNLADRARDGSVIDFIDPVAWPAFNIADIAVVVGILGFVYVAEVAREAEDGGEKKLVTDAFSVEPVRGERLDVALGADPRVGSRAAAQKLIEAGAVTVDGVVRQKRYVLRGGETVSVTRTPPPEPDMAGAADVSFEVAFEDEYLIVVDKPAGLVVHPSAGHSEATLVQGLAGRAAGGDDPWRPGVVHRLDKDTSGLLVVAKSEEAHRRLQKALRERRVRREYLALIDGRPDARSGTIDAPIGRDRRDRTVHSTTTDKPREALTHFWTEEDLPRTTLLRVRLETGRTHQIRVHLAAIGHPVCGDRQYGGAACGARLGLTRQFLHSAALRFQHPIGGAEVACESKLPADLRATYAAAAREPASEGPDGG